MYCLSYFNTRFIFIFDFLPFWLGERSWSLGFTSYLIVYSYLEWGVTQTRVTFKHLELCPKNPIFKAHSITLTNVERCNTLSYYTKVSLFKKYKKDSRVRTFLHPVKSITFHVAFSGERFPTKKKFSTSGCDILL